MKILSPLQYVVAVVPPSPTNYMRISIVAIIRGRLDGASDASAEMEDTPIQAARMQEFDRSREYATAGSPG